MYKINLPVPELVEGNVKRPFQNSLVCEPTAHSARGKRGEGYIFHPFDKLRDQKQALKFAVRRVGNFAPLFLDKFRDQINIEMLPVSSVKRFKSVSCDRPDTYNET